MHVLIWLAHADKEWKFQLVFSLDIRESLPQDVPRHLGKDRSEMGNKKDALQGTLDLLILRTLAHGPLHGYGIVLHIERISEDVLRVEEGSLYPALHRIEQDGWIGSEWKTTDNNRRAKYYKLTASGRKRLAEEEDNWMRLTRAVAKVLRFA